MGNYRLKTVTDDTDYTITSLRASTSKSSEYRLKRVRSFATPRLALTFSKEGLSGASRNFHRWGRRYQLANGDKERMHVAQQLGGRLLRHQPAGHGQDDGRHRLDGRQLFVMDDGWFGDKYPRKRDDTSLGDWVVDKNKLPEGIEGLLRDARKHGVKFGIWIEPEMTNTLSELYEKHPRLGDQGPQPRGRGRDAAARSSCSTWETPRCRTLSLASSTTS